MGRLRLVRPLEVAGFATCALLALALGAWVAGVAWVAVGSALAGFAVGAAVAGTDTRSAGDWTDVGPR